MKSQKVERKDRTYKLLGGQPLSWVLHTRHSKRKPLLYYDEEKQMQRALRYASNQATPFWDDQDENAIIEPVVFIRGLLFVPKTNPVLQYFLSITPEAGRVFEEMDVEKNAAKDLERDDVRLDAEIAARELTLEQAETIARVVLSLKVDTMTSSEIKKDVRVYAKKNPEDFLGILNDPMLKVGDLAAKAIESKLLTLRNNQRDIYYNFSNNKKKLLSVPFDTKPLDVLSSYLQTDEGIELSSILETKLKEQE